MLTAVQFCDAVISKWRNNSSTSCISALSFKLYVADAALLDSLSADRVLCSCIDDFLRSDSAIIHHPRDQRTTRTENALIRDQVLTVPVVCGLGFSPLVDVVAPLLGPWCVRLLGCACACAPRLGWRCFEDGERAVRLGSDGRAAER